MGAFSFVSEEAMEGRSMYASEAEEENTAELFAILGGDGEVCKQRPRALESTTRFLKL